MQYADSAAAEAAENALRQLAETGAVPAAWAAEALDTAETGESYTDWDGKYYSLDATYCVTDSLGFVTVRRFGMTDNALFTRYSVTIDSRTGTVVEAWLSMTGTDAENTPLPTETALRSFAAQAGLESLGDWGRPPSTAPTAAPSTARTAVRSSPPRPTPTPTRITSVQRRFRQTAGTTA